MVQYVNAFTLTTNEKRSEVIFKFSQTFPDASAPSVSVDPVANIIMPGELAQELVKKLQAMMTEDE